MHGGENGLVATIGHAKFHANLRKQLFLMTVLDKPTCFGYNGIEYLRLFKYLWEYAFHFGVKQTLGSHRQASSSK